MKKGRLTDNILKKSGIFPKIQSKKKSQRENVLEKQFLVRFFFSPHFFRFFALIFPRFFCPPQFSAKNQQKISRKSAKNHHFFDFFFSVHFFKVADYILFLGLKIFREKSAKNQQKIATFSPLFHHFFAFFFYRFL